MMPRLRWSLAGLFLATAYGVAQEAQPQVPEPVVQQEAPPQKLEIVITDLGLLRPDPVSRELRLVQVHPGVTVDRVRAATGWPLIVADDLTESAAPTDEELAALRKLEGASP